MFSILKYGISILVWAVVAAFLIFTGKTVYLVFWALIGLFLLIIWLGKIVYKVATWFNPDFKPIKIILTFIIIIVAALVVFKVFIAPSWNTYGSTKDEIENHYKVDDYCDKANIRVVRTVEIKAPPEYIFKWIRQMPEVRTYSWGIPGLGSKKSAGKLLEDLPDLQEGDDFVVGKVVDVDKGKSLTLNIGEDPKMPKLGIDCMYSGYYFKKKGDVTRVTTVIRANYRNLFGWFYSQAIIEIGDFFFATKQLTKLKEIAEENFKE